ncbi:hypothetical protein CspHIS471_0700340 [Cutaneotrichosporon sp. HIS471]|nr:hypothetical protein CspHIS471_0700340 [Cutaneotrichosporon sp. HIS471]
MIYLLLLLLSTTSLAAWHHPRGTYLLSTAGFGACLEPEGNFIGAELVLSNCSNAGAIGYQYEGPLTRIYFLEYDKCLEIPNGAWSSQSRPALAECHDATVNVNQIWTPTYANDKDERTFIIRWTGADGNGDGCIDVPNGAWWRYLYRDKVWMYWCDPKNKNQHFWMMRRDLPADAGYGADYLNLPQESWDYEYDEPAIVI